MVMRALPETTLAEKMSTVRFRVDSEPHIVVDSRICQECTLHSCIYVCPANLFSLLSDGSILFNYEQCFECGSCYVACNREGAITWRYPRGGYGVSFRDA
jgi:ferredoxin like protein